MASLSQGLPAHAGGAAEASLESAMTTPVTRSGEYSTAANITAGTDACGTKSSSPGMPDDHGSDAGEASAAGDRSQALSRIKKLQDELVKIERSFRLKQDIESIKCVWDTDFERLGREAEQRNWAQGQQIRAQSLIKDTTAFVIGREWTHESEDSFIWSLLEREERDKYLIENRAEWEAKKGITQPQADDSLRPTWNGLSQLPIFLDPLSDESKFNATDEAQGYDHQERSLRMQIHETVRDKRDAFKQWKFLSSNVPEVPELFPDLWPNPVLNYVQWKLFKYCSPNRAMYSEEKKDLAAIDVLDGEPDLRVSRTSYNQLIRTMRHDGNKISSSIPKMAHGLVPERIRLNGPQFTQTIRLLTPSDIPYPYTHQVVLLQPYRLLVYHDKAIRDRYETLKENMGLFGDQAVMFQAETELETVHHEAVQSAVEHVDNGDPNSARELSRKHQTGAEPRHQAVTMTRHDGAKEPQRQPEDDLSGKSEEAKFPLANTNTALAFLDCLINFMDTTISIRRDYIQGPECRKIHFRDLWYLFNPGDEIVRHDEKQVYRVIEVMNPRHRASFKNVFLDNKDTSTYFQVSCVYVDFDGKRLGPVTEDFRIKAFAGERKVESLDIYPLRLHRHSAQHEKKPYHQLSGSQTLRQALIERGKMFVRAARMKLKNAFYHGPTADGDEIESQIVVDFETALSSDKTFAGDAAPQLTPLVGHTIADDATIVEDPYPPCKTCCEGEYVHDDSWVDKIRRKEYIDSLIPEDSFAKLPSVAAYPRNLDDVAGDNDLTDDELILMSYRVLAFVLRTRKWAQLDLLYMEDESDAKSHENEEVSQPAFDQLVLPEGHKDVVMSLISQHYRNKDSGRRSINQSDIVKGKGKGLILLLHGAPGVGKTSTAEGIAEKFKKPLFTITCGDLGSTAKEVEQALDLNFTLANRWGCILLLDEADVFLSSRLPTDFERNALVAVFLRVLEYYAGILFLTTNRVGVIDEAFRSRIHISLYYPPLGPDETRAVFKLNLKLIQDRFNNDKRNITIERDAIIDFALEYFEHNEKARWNGRQIRNACQTALALAEFKAQGANHEKVLDPNADVRLAVESFKVVSKAYLDFTKYLKKLYGSNDEAKAAERGLRARESSGQSRAQPTQPAVSRSDFVQPGSQFRRNEPYNSASGNTTQAVYSQLYQPAPMVGAHINPGLGGRQPSQQSAYNINPTQLASAGIPVAYGPSGQYFPGQIPQQGQEYGGMQFQPVQGNINQQNQSWEQLSPQNSAVPPQSPPSVTQQQYQDAMQLNTSQGHLGSQVPTSQPFPAQQAMYSQQAVQNQQQQAPQQWYPNVNVQDMRAASGQNPPGPSPPEEGQ